MLSLTLDTLDHTILGQGDTYPRDKKVGQAGQALCNIAWREHFENATVRHLPTNQSDHCPILVSTTGANVWSREPKPFRFLSSWMTHERFGQLLKDNWDNTKPFIHLLKEFTDNLQNWNKEVFGNIFRKKKLLWARIQGIQLKLHLPGNMQVPFET